MVERIILFFIVVAIFLVLIIAVRKNIFRDILEMYKVAQITSHNIEYQFFPDREKPIVYLEREFALRNSYPYFFNTFSDEDWHKFWNIIYGVHSGISFKNKKFPKALRNYYIKEIEEELILHYPEFFKNFNKDNWSDFWGIIFGIKRQIETEMDDTIIDLEKGPSVKVPKATIQKEKIERKISEDNKNIDETVETVRREIGY